MQNQLLDNNNHVVVDIPNTDLNNNIRKGRSMAARTNNDAPFIGFVAWIEWTLTFIFGLLIQIILIPFRLLSLPYSWCCTPKWSGKTPPNEIPSPVVEGDLADIRRVADELKLSYIAGETRPYNWRVQQIRGIQQLLRDNDAEIYAAYKSDLGKPVGDWLMESLAIHGEAEHAITHLHEYMQPERRWTPLWQQPGNTKIYYEPLGTVLVIGPYNYPINLVLAPMISALSAGCNIMVKPSEQMPATAQLMADLLPQYLSPHACRVVTGGIPETNALLEIKWDKIFFTGSGRVAQLIEKKIAGTLTPCCFELGGKSPCIVDASANLTVACRRIVQGKFFNAGATCIAPDYLLVEDVIYERFVSMMVKELKKQFGEDPSRSKDYANVLNEAHLQRLTGYINDAVEKGAKVEVGQNIGHEVDVVNRYMAPTILSGVSDQMLCMKEEIFGPVLPILKMNGGRKNKVKMIDGIVEFIQGREIPLSCYVFTSDSVMRKAIVGRVQSGSMCVNDTVLQVTSPDIPFGGVGASGMGNYHGREGFKCFSHAKSCFSHDTNTDCFTPFRYAPFSTLTHVMLKLVMGRGY